ncbi:MAG: AAA family ATPase [Candidatus Parvarchaeota archaeon]
MEADYDDKITKAAKILKELYEKTDKTEKKRIDEERDSVISKYQEYFKFENIDSLTFEKLEEFAKFKNNHHWEGIFRHSQEVKENFTTNKEAIKLLVDPNGGNIGDRLSQANEKAKGMGPAILTAILLVVFPDKYSVLNDVSYKALKRLNLISFENSNNGLIENYEKANEVVLKLKELTQLDLWTLDSMFYKLTNSDKSTTAANKPKWYVEKTYLTKHSIPGIINSKVGEMLWSPKTSKNGSEIYKNMKKIQPGDYVIHLLMDHDNEIEGVSIADGQAESFKIPEGLSWSGDGYSVKLKGYEKLSTPIKWKDLASNFKDKLTAILNKNKKVFYNKDLDLNQGAYLTEAPYDLVAIINNEYHNKTNENLPYFKDLNVAIQSESRNGGDGKIQDMPKNFILHGPVGTGKTYLARLIAKGLVHGRIKNLNDIEKVIGAKEEELKELSDLEEDREKIVTVTFHQSYGYEDFIGGIKAQVNGDKITYKAEPGVFLKLCDKARNDLKNPYVIIIDEINRGDISRIFGELITLIEEDKRSSNDTDGMSLTIPNFEVEFRVPENVFIIGTMNDSDRSIALLDVALRRRFLFFNILPRTDILKEWVSKKTDTAFGRIVVDVFEKLNERILSTRGEDFQIGHAFFKDLSTTDNYYETLQQIFKYKIFPLLKEIYIGRDEVLYEKVLNNAFYKKEEFDGFNEKPIYKLKEDLFNESHTQEKFKEEISKLIGNNNDKK